jgi:hypothetical protein
MRADPASAAREAEEQQRQPTTTPTAGTERLPMARRVTELPVFTPPATRQQPRGGNDGVFANLAAKPERGDSGDEKPPVRTFDIFYKSSSNPRLSLTIPISRPTNPLPQTQPHPIGKPPLLSPDPASPAQTKST